MAKTLVRFILLAVAVIAFRGSAGEVTWIGNGTNNWKDAENWSPSVPAAGDDVVLTTALPQPSTQDIPGLSINSLRFEINDQHLQVQGNAITLTSNSVGLSMDPPGDGSVTIACDIVIAKNQTWNIPAGSTLTLAGNVSSTSDSLFNGLVNYYSFDEAGGNIAYDTTGTRDGALNAGATRVAGQFGGAVEFNGAGGNVNIPNYHTIAPTTEITVDFWQKENTIRNSSTFDLSPEQTNNRINAHITWSDGNIYFDFGDLTATGAANGRIFYTPADIVGTWQHITMTSSKTTNTMQIYRNGVVEASKNGAAGTFNPNGNGAIGYAMQIGGSLNYFDGAVDEFRVYNRVLGAAEVQALQTSNGQASLTITGGGRVWATANWSMSTPLAVAQGRLKLDNNSISGGLLTLGNGGALEGAGSAGQVISSGGIMWPGGSATSGTLNTKNLTLDATSTIRSDLNLAPNPSDLIAVTGNLTLDGFLDVESLPGEGTYDIVSYTGTLTNTGLIVRTLPDGFAGRIDTSTNGVVRLVVGISGPKIWTGAGANSNWSNPANWQGNIVPFDGDDIIVQGSGLLTMDVKANVGSMAISRPGDTVFDGKNTLSIAGTLTFTNAPSCTMSCPLEVTALTVWDISDAGTLTVSGGISGIGGITKIGGGTLIVASQFTYTGPTTINSGTVKLNASPLSVTSGLKMWLDAGRADGTGAAPADGAAIAKWTDLSNSGSDATQPQATMQPVVKYASDAGGRAVMHFDGQDDYFSFTRISTIRAVFMMLKEDVSATPVYRFILGDDTSYHFHRGGGNIIFSNVWAHANIQSGSTRLNGTVINGTITPMPTSFACLSVLTTGNVEANMLVNDRFLAQRVWWGDIAEVLIYDRPLTATEVDNVENYLMKKYGTGAAQLPANSALTVAAGGTLDMTGATVNVGSLAGGGNIIADDGTLTVGGNNSSTEFSGVFSGANAKFAKIGTGTQILSGANTFTGAASVASGVLQISNTSSISTAKSVSVLVGGTLALSGSVSIAEKPLTLSGTGASGSGALRTLAGNSGWLGTITVNNGAAIGVDGGGVLSLNNDLTLADSGQLRVRAPDASSAGKMLSSARVTLSVDAVLVVDLAGYPDGVSSQFIALEAASLTKTFGTVQVLNDAGTAESVKVSYRDGGAGRQVIVTINNIVPVADAGADKAANEGGTVSMTGTFTDANALDTHTHTWTVSADNGQVIAPGSTADFSFVPNDNGVYTLTYKVTDSNGGSGTDTMTVTVSNVSPANVSAGSNQNVSEGDVVTLNGTFNDPGSADTQTYLWHVAASNGQTISDGTTQNFSFVPADEGTYTINFTVTDDDGGSASATTTVTAANVAPRSVSMGGDQTVSEGISIDLAAAFDDPGSADAHTYTWSVVSDNGQSIPNGAAKDFSFIANDNGTYTVTLDVTDDNGGEGSVTSVMTIENANPTAVVTNSGDADEGSTATSVMISGEFDLSSVDTAAGFSYSYDFNNDGIFELGDGSYAGGVPETSAVVPGIYLTDGPGERLVHVRISDKDDGFTDYLSTITLANVNPAGTFAAVGPILEGTNSKIGFSGVSDPSQADRDAGFTYSFDLADDGVFEVTGTNATATIPASLIPEGVSTRRVAGMISDKDGGSTVYRLTLIVENVPPKAEFQKAAADSNPDTLGRVEFVNAFDPSAADTAAGFHYAYDFDDDGNFEIGDGSYGGSAPFAESDVPAQYQSSVPPKTVRARIIDSDNGFTEYRLQRPYFSSSLFTATADLGTFFAFDIASAGSPAPAISISALALPAGVASLADVGLAYDGAQGQISGTLLKAGQLSILMQASNTGGTAYSVLLLTIRRPGGNTGTPRFVSPARVVPNPLVVGVVADFIASATDDDGDLLSYAWDFADGSTDAKESHKPAAKHAYAAAGTYDVVVTVQDGEHTLTQTIKVRVVPEGGNTFDVKTAAFTFDFTNASKSSVSIAGSLPTEPGFKPAGLVANVSFRNSNYAQAFTLDSKGKAGDKYSAFTLNAAAKTGGSKFSLKLKGNPSASAEQTLFALLAPLDFVNENKPKPGINLTLPFIVEVGVNGPGINNIRVNYTAVAGKKGTAKKLK